MGVVRTNQSHPLRRSRRNQWLRSLALCVMVGISEVSSKTLPELIEQMQRGELTAEERFPLEGAQLSDQMNRKLERPITPQFAEPCFYEGDGCATCWIDRYYQIAQWDCPDFCGEGRDFVGHVHSNFDAETNRYVPEVAECELLLCIPLKKGTCDNFEGNPAIPTDENNQINPNLLDTWTCQEQCFPETIKNASSNEDGFLSPGILATLIVITVGGAGLLAILIQYYCFRNEDFQEKAEFLPATRPREKAVEETEDSSGGSYKTCQEPLPQPGDFVYSDEEESEDESEDETIQMC